MSGGVYLAYAWIKSIQTERFVIYSTHLVVTLLIGRYPLSEYMHGFKLWSSADLSLW